MKRAIVFELDNNLRSMSYKKTGFMLDLRPNMEELVTTLQESKSKDPDLEIVLYNSRVDPSYAQSTLDLNPQLAALIDRQIYGCGIDYDGSPIENKYGKILRIDDISLFPIEKELNDYCYKGITALGYDQILFFETSEVFISPVVATYLKYKEQGIEPNIDATAFQIKGFYGYNEMKLTVLAYLATNSTDEELANKAIKQIEEIQMQDSGCHTMSQAIKDFMDKEFEPGLRIKSYLSLQDDNKFTTVAQLRALMDKAHIPFEKYESEDRVIHIANQLDERMYELSEKYFRKELDIPPEIFCIMEKDCANRCEFLLHAIEEINSNREKGNKEIEDLIDEVLKDNGEKSLIDDKGREM